MTILAELIIPECDQPIFNRINWFEGVWEFPCGLSLADKLIEESIDTRGCLTNMHEDHHKHMIDNKPWDIESTIDVQDNGFTILFKCGCSNANN